MRELIAYQSVPWAVPENFDGSAQGVSDDGPGRFKFTNREPANLRGLVIPRFSFTFYTAAAAPSVVSLYLRNPTNFADRKIIFEDSTGTVTNFVEDNLGQGQPVPYLNGLSGQRYDLIFVTTDPIGARRALLEFWWEPVESFDQYSCRSGNDVR